MINARTIIFINNVTVLKFTESIKEFLQEIIFFCKFCFPSLKIEIEVFFVFVFCFLDTFYVKSGSVRWFDSRPDSYLLASRHYLGSLILLH